MDKDDNALIHTRDHNLNTPLHAAAAAGYYETVELLISRGAEVSARDWQGNTPLHKTKCHKVAAILLRNGASARDKNDKSQSALHRIYTDLSSRSLKEITELLIDHGAEVDGQDDAGQSPVHLAAQHLNPEALIVLVRKGANINIQDNAGWYPLHSSVKYHFNNSASVEFLLEQGASPDVQDWKGNTPLHQAAAYGYERGAIALLRKGVKIDVQNGHGWTALHVAVHYDEYEVITKLLAYGFSLSAKVCTVCCMNNKGKTPYEMVKSSESRRLMTTCINLSNLAGLQVCEQLKVDFILSEDETIKALLELERIKATNISKQLCLYDVFAQSRPPSYLLYEGVVEDLEICFQLPDFHHRFPIYADILKGTFKRCKGSRYYLTRKAAVTMMSRTRKEWCRLTPDLAWGKVFNFLSLDEIINIILSEH